MKGVFNLLPDHPGVIVVQVDLALGNLDPNALNGMRAGADRNFHGAGLCDELHVGPRL
jgi:hypothetical protein